MTHLRTELSALRLIAVSLLYAIPAFLIVRAIWRALGWWSLGLTFVVVLAYMWVQGRGHSYDSLELQFPQLGAEPKSDRRMKGLIMSEEYLFEKLLLLPPLVAVVAWDVHHSKVGEETVALAGQIDLAEIKFGVDLVKMVAAWNLEDADDRLLVEQLEITLENL